MPSRRISLGRDLGGPAREKKARDSGPVGGDLANQLEAARARHLVIREERVDAPLAQRAQRRRGVLGRHDLVALAAQAALQRRQDARLVVDDEQHRPLGGPLTRRPRPPPLRPGAGRSRTRVRPPASLSTRSVPPWRFTMLYAIERPSPVPTPTSLVVKNGSKMRCRWSRRGCRCRRPRPRPRRRRPPPACAGGSPPAAPGRGPPRRCAW